MKPHILVLVILCYLHKCFAKYNLQELTIEALRPRGLRVSMPVTPNEDVQLFAFHANINKSIRGKEQGDISRSATKSINGKWIIRDDKIELKKGDKVHYWIFAQNNRLGFDKEDQVYEVTSFTDTAEEGKCPPSVSKFNNDEDLCANAIIFDDDFRNDVLDETIWDVLQFTPQYALPGREFVSYEKKSENIFIQNKILHIKPTIRQRDEDILAFPFDLTNVCTENKITACLINAANSYEIVPPVASARIRSKIAFKYGRVEIRAKLPIGDWLVPHLLLEPKDYEYGPDFASGEIYIAYSRGNTDLKSDGKDIGKNTLFTGPALSQERSRYMFELPYKISWGAAFHTYSAEWSPDGITYMIDDNKVYEFKTPIGGYSSLTGNLNYSRNWKTKNAPFDKSFHLTLGLSAGGIIDFPKDAQNRGHRLPWEDTNPRAPLAFFESRSEWESTWSDDSTLKIEYVKVYAI